MLGTFSCRQFVPPSSPPASQAYRMPKLPAAPDGTNPVIVSFKSRLDSSDAWPFGTGIGHHLQVGGAWTQLGSAQGCWCSAPPTPAACFVCYALHRQPTADQLLSPPHSPQKQALVDKNPPAMMVAYAASRKFGSREELLELVAAQKIRFYAAPASTLLVSGGRWERGRALGKGSNLRPCE